MKIVVAGGRRVLCEFDGDTRPAAWPERQTARGVYDNDQGARRRWEAAIARSR